MRIKILHFIYPHIWGGTEQFLFTLLKHLDRKKFVPVVASFDSGRFVEKFRSLGVRTLVVPSGKKDPAPWERLIKKEGARIAQTNIFNFSLALAARRAGIPHVWQINTHIDCALEDLTARGKRDYLNLISSLSERIVCFSRFLKMQFQPLEATNVTVVYPGVDWVEIQERVNDSKLPRDNGFLVAMVGHLHPQKRHLDFIEAAKKVYEKYPGSRFLILGGLCWAYDGGRSYAEGLFRRIRKLQPKVQKRISLVSFCQNILGEISEADIVVLPSIQEGAGLSLLEAMALKKPVVAARSGGIPELVEHGRTGFLVSPKSPQALAQAILKLLRDKEKARRMGEAGRSRVERLFDIRKIVRSYEKIYRELLQRCG